MNDGDYLGCGCGYVAWCPSAGHFQMNLLVPSAVVLFPRPPGNMGLKGTILTCIICLAVTSSHGCVRSWREI